MENRSRRSTVKSVGGRSKRSRTATPGTKSRKSIGSRSRRSGGTYKKLKEADEVEMADLGAIGP